MRLAASVSRSDRNRSRQIYDFSHYHRLLFPSPFSPSLSLSPLLKQHTRIWNNTEEREKKKKKNLSCFFFRPTFSPHMATKRNFPFVFFFSSSLLLLLLILSLRFIVFLLRHTTFDTQHLPWPSSAGRVLLLRARARPHTERDNDDRHIPSISFHMRPIANNRTRNKRKPNQNISVEI